MQKYQPGNLSVEQVERLEGNAVLDFGTNWCGFCRRAAPLIEQALQQRPDVSHLPIEDGEGRPLGRAFSIKLWPTLVFLRNGSEVARVTRPDTADALREALARLA